MAYITPVTNRTANSFFNVADWSRIHDNSKLLNSLMRIVWDAGLFIEFTVPIITTNPELALSNLNTMLENIEVNMRQYVTTELPALTPVKYDWPAGRDVDSPSYIHANQWEITIDAMWEYFDGPDLLVCPTLEANLTILTGTYLVVVDCIDVDDFELVIEGTGRLFVI